MLSLRTIKYTVGELWKKIFRRVSRYARSYALNITYYVVLPVIGFGGSKLVIKKPDGGTSWENMKDTPVAFIVSPQSGKSWLLDFITQTFNTGNFRVLALLPLIIILKIFDDPAEEPSSAALLIYTLY